MKEDVIQFIRREGLLLLTDRILVAVSGGRDSVCLAHLLHSSGYNIALAHVNYGLRGQASDLDEEVVRSLGLQWQVETHVKHIDPQSFTQQSLQEAARNIRYSFFNELAEKHGYSAIATAHHREDQVETLFLNLLRGTGIHGLKGIPAKRDNIVRPLLHTSREEINHYVQEHGLAYRDDASNEGVRYTRNRIRHHLIPMLSEIDTEATHKLDRSMALLSEDAQAVTQMAASLLEETADGWLLNLRSLPKTVRAVWCYHCLRPFGFNRQQAADIQQSGTTGKFIENTLYTAVLKGDLLIVRANSPAPAEPLTITGPGDHRFGEMTLHIALRHADPENMPRDNRSVWLDASRLHFPLVLRVWEPGDRFQPLGCPYEVKISDFLTDRKVDRIAKRNALVLCDARGKVLWLVNHQVADFAKIDTATSEIYSCTIS